MASLDLSQILQATTQSNQGLTRAADEITGYRSQMNSAAETAKQATADAASAESLIENTKQAAEIRKQQNVSKASAALGMDINAAGEMITPLSQKIRESQDRLFAAIEKKKEADSVSILSDPIGWMVGRISGEFDQIEAEHTAAKELNLAAVSSLKNLLALKNDVAITENNARETTSAAAAEAQTKLIADKAILAGYKIDQENIGKNVEMINQLKNLQHTSLTNAQAAFNAVKADQQIGMEATRLALARNADARAATESRIRIADHAASLREKLSKEKQTSEDESATIAQIQAGARALGMTDLTTLNANSFRRAKQIGLTSELEQAWKAGGKMVEGNTRNPVLASTPGEMAVMSLGGVPFRPEQQRIKGVITDIAEGVAAANGLNAAAIKKDPVTFAGVVSKTVDARIKTDPKWVTDKLVGNPNFGAMEATLPNIVKSKFYQTVITPQRTAGMKSMDPETLFATAEQAIANKLITPQDAAEGLSSIFTGQLLTFAATENPKSLGIPQIEEYPVKVKGASGSKVINGADYTSMNHYFTQRALSRRVGRGTDWR